MTTKRRRLDRSAACVAARDCVLRDWLGVAQRQSRDRGGQPASDRALAGYLGNENILGRATPDLSGTPCELEFEVKVLHCPRLGVRSQPHSTRSHRLFLGRHRQSRKDQRQAPYPSYSPWMWWLRFAVPEKQGPFGRHWGFSLQTGGPVSPVAGQEQPYLRQCSAPQQKCPHVAHAQHGQAAIVWWPMTVAHARPVGRRPACLLKLGGPRGASPAMSISAMEMATIDVEDCALKAAAHGRDRDAPGVSRVPTGGCSI